MVMMVYGDGGVWYSSSPVSCIELWSCETLSPPHSHCNANAKKGRWSRVRPFFLRGGLGELRINFRAPPLFPLPFPRPTFVVVNVKKETDVEGTGSLQHTRASRLRPLSPRVGEG